MKLGIILLAVTVGLPTAAPVVAAETPIAVVAAENFYGEMAAAIGGDRIVVDTVAVSPDTDPHDFAPPPSVARAVADARVVIMNGLEYDHWMEQLLAATPSGERSVLEVATLIRAEEGDNPHLWYDPKAVPALASAFAATLSEIDPAGAAEYQSRLKDYAASLDALNQRIATIRDRYAGTEVAASEPVFGLMAEALGLKMVGEDFQHAVMNETEPSARAIAEVEDDIRSGRVKVFFYNSQVVDPMTERLLTVAEKAGVPVVAVTESMPAGKTYAGWMLDQLEATARALSAPAS